MDIKESKEYRLAKDWEMAVNSFSFNPCLLYTSPSPRD